ncbi:carboxymuconolactone decarboxylase family protein [Pseudogracilibacillus sp. SO30301A]|uniref:carboxymuconolactone decarboxylase family protein n=1 Tax=Pseudogracilibacillus sp. SO30301A TaxID=3098291 RepID=UPI00300DD387
MSAEDIKYWEKVLEKYNRTALVHYKALEDSVLSEGIFEKKDKHLILVGVNAARRYDPELLYHAKCAYDLGATIEELVDILTSCILSRGIPVWLEGIKAIELILEKETQSINEKSKKINPIESLDKAIEYFKNDNKGKVPGWVNIMQKYSPNSLVNYASLRRDELCDAIVSRKIKELVLVGINLAERYELGVKLHINGAKREGATDEEIAEVAMLCIVTAGIPAWIGVSDFL